MTKSGTLKIQVVQAGLYLPILHPEIWDTQNKLKSPHDIKESVYIVGDVMAKEANEGQPSMQQKVDEAKKSRETRDNISTTEGFETNNRCDLGNNR